MSNENFKKLNNEKAMHFRKHEDLHIFNFKIIFGGKSKIKGKIKLQALMKTTP